MPLFSRVAAKRLAEGAFAAVYIVAFAIICCPCLVCATLASARCGHDRRRQRERRNIRIHPSIIVAPAPPPAYATVVGSAEGEVDGVLAHLKNDGNRIFHLRPNGMLECGNIAAARTLEMTGSPLPRLVAVVPREKWKRLLAVFMAARSEVVKGKKGFWRSRESKWVERCCEMLAGWEKELGSPDEGGWLEVWAVQVKTTHLSSVVYSDLMGPAQIELEFIRDEYVWATAVYPLHLLGIHVTTAEDFFPGRWAEEYVHGDGEPLSVERILHGYGLTWPRRSVDSGQAEFSPEDDDE